MIDSDVSPLFVQCTTMAVEGDISRTPEVHTATEVVKPKMTYAQAVTCSQRSDTKARTEVQVVCTAKQGTLLPDRFDILLSLWEE
ncbi:hypothetical protein F2Q69_00001138 [Brassica cretica]|uniref:Uncharacterized protein n=1 Tax=Brassica cretica TaxID=69181 RepID=A0A8S9PJ66_BRACR|nr:hypothetical protein F2Q69_00001138 [Brassica cretica]